MECRFVADGVGFSMPVLRASSLALFAVGSLEARGGDAHK
jgi:hypothetical protein